MPTGKKPAKATQKAVPKVATTKMMIATAKQTTRRVPIHLSKNLAPTPVPQAPKTKAPAKPVKASAPTAHGAPPAQDRSSPPPKRAITKTTIATAKSMTISKRKHVTSAPQGPKM
jgi:type IV secretory pathway TrbL component